MTIAEHLPTIGLVGSVTATSYTLFSHVGLVQYGTIPLLRGVLSPAVRIKPSDKVKAWSAFYKNGAFYTLGATALNVAFCGLSAATNPSNYISKLSVASAVVGLTIVPFTYGFIMPVNNELAGLEKSINTDALPDSVDGKRADELVDRWDTLHKVRFLAYGGAWLLAMAALVLDRRVVVNVVDVAYSARG